MLSLSHTVFHYSTNQERNKFAYSTNLNLNDMFKTAAFAIGEYCDFNQKNVLKY